jgi:hypothetical protein
MIMFSVMLLKYVDLKFWRPVPYPRARVEDSNLLLSELLPCSAERLTIVSDEGMRPSERQSRNGLYKHVAPWYESSHRSTQGHLFFLEISTYIDNEEDTLKINDILCHLKNITHGTATA